MSPSPNPATTDWVPIWGSGSPGGSYVPLPVVNGQWVKGVGGAAVWSAITAADITGVGVVKEVGTTGLKAQIVPQVTLAFPANDGSGNSQAVLTLPVAWPTLHAGFAVGYLWPLGHWNFTMKLVATTGLGGVTIMMNQAGGAQNMNVGGVSFGY